MITVIIPTYNYARYLPQAINSVIEQTFSDWQLIIIDSSSTDNTHDVVKPFLKDKRIQYIIVEQKGVSYARNQALKWVKTPYIQFLDADDWLLPEKFEVMLKHCTNEVDLVYSEARYYRANFNQLLYSMHLPDKKWMPGCSGKNVISFLIRNNIMPINAPIFKASLIDRFGCFDEKLTGLEDWELWLRFAINGATFKYIEAQNIAAVIRIHQSSASTNIRMMQQHVLPVLYRYLNHKSLSFKSKLYLFLRCFETYWDSIIASNKSASVKLSWFILLCWFVLLPVYFIIKMVRLLK